MDKAIVPMLLLCDSVWMLNNRSFCARFEDENKTKLEQKGIEQILNVIPLGTLRAEQCCLICSIV